jgi:hypothetical protein
LTERTAKTATRLLRRSPSPHHPLGVQTQVSRNVAAAKKGDVQALDKKDNLEAPSEESRP